jgi:hypothetical protein
VHRLAPLLLLLAPLPARARPTLTILAQLDNGPARAGPVHARRGQRVTLYALVRDGARLWSDAPTIAFGRRRLQPRPLAELGVEGAAWSLVEPHPHHHKLAPPNPGNSAYSNAVLFGPNHGRWRGYDRIEYHETALGERSPTLRVTRATPSNPKVNVHDGLGTMRYKVSLRVAGRALTSPGAEAADARGLRPSVMRVSFRDGDDLVGWLAAYFNVPNVFGSGGSGRTHQAELFQGADCADVIIGAARLAGASLPYTSVLGLRAHARPVTGRLLLDESGVYEPAIPARGERSRAELPAGATRGQRVRLRFGAEVRRGDIMLIDYVGFTDSPRSWDHVAVVARDAGKAGEFDPDDRILHMGYLYGLTEAAAKSEGPAVVQFLRLRYDRWHAPARRASLRRDLATAGRL